MVARSAGGREVAGSNPVAPITKQKNIVYDEKGTKNGVSQKLEIAIRHFSEVCFRK